MFSAGPSNQDGKRVVLPKAIEQEISHGILNLTQRLHQLQLLSKSEEEIVEETTVDAGKEIITISGRNNGATMNMGFSPNELEARRSSVSTDHTTINIYINSNVQGVNNSILYNSSCTLRDPGVHFEFSNLEKPSESSRRGDEGSVMAITDPRVPDLEIKPEKERKFTGRKRSWSEILSEPVVENEMPKSSLDTDIVEWSSSVNAQIHGGSSECSVQNEVTSKEIVKEENLSGNKPSKMSIFIRKCFCSMAVME